MAVNNGATVTLLERAEQALTTVGRHADSGITHRNFHLGAAAARLQSDFPLWWGIADGVAEKIEQDLL